MKLKERAEKAWNNYEYREGNLYSNCFKDGFEQGAKIVEEFAIEFAEWLIKKQTNYFESLKELLEQFKKEKGL